MYRDQFLDLYEVYCDCNSIVTNNFWVAFAIVVILKVIYHPLYGMNNYVLIWGDWLSCDPLRGSHDSQSPHIRKHLCPILWQL